MKNKKKIEDEDACHAACAQRQINKNISTIHIYGRIQQKWKRSQNKLFAIFIEADTKGNEKNNYSKMK